MPPKRQSFMDPEDVTVSSRPAIDRMGIRVEMIVDELAAKRFPEVAIAHVIEGLSQRLVYDNRAAIERAVESFLHDRAWAEAAVREAIGVSVHRIIREMLESSPLGEVLKPRALEPNEENASGPVDPSNPRSSRAGGES